MDTFSIAYEGRIIGDTSKVTLPEGFTLDSRGYIVREGEDDHHYVTVPKMAAGVFVPVVVNQTAAGDFIVGNLAPAEATALKIENGQVRLTVEVDASTDLKNWKPAKTVEIDVPVEGEKGFYILKSK